MSKPDFERTLRNVILRQSQIVNTRMMGRAVIRVVRRCNEAMEDSNLNLSSCQLMMVPDAVYHLLRNTNLLSVNLASNELSKINSRFPAHFTNLTELNLSNNRMSRLPEELLQCQNLERLDISHNSFISIPPVVFRLTNLRILNASNNNIIDVDVSQLPSDSKIEEVDLTENPLLPSCHQMLTESSTIQVKLSPREKEEWEDLDV